MEIRKAVKSDVNNIMKIIKQAQEYFKNQGIDQWQNNYPNIDTINSDILNGNNYVMIKDNDIVATAVIIFMKDNGLLILTIQLYIELL